MFPATQINILAVQRGAKNPSQTPFETLIKFDCADLPFASYYDFSRPNQIYNMYMRLYSIILSAIQLRENASLEKTNIMESPTWDFWNGRFLKRLDIILNQKSFPLNMVHCIILLDSSTLFSFSLEKIGIPLLLKISSLSCK